MPDEANFKEDALIGWNSHKPNQSSDDQVGALTTCQDAQENVETLHASRMLADMIMCTHATYP